MTQSSDSPSASARAGRLPIAVTDLLLILIVALGGARLLLPLLLEPLGLALRAGDGAGPGTGTIIALLAVQTAFLFAVIYAIAILWRRARWADLGFRPLPSGWGWRAVGVALLAFPAVSGVTWLQMQLLGRQIENPQMDLLAPERFDWSMYLAMLLVAGLLAPLVEEVAFRGLLYRWLRERAGIWIAAAGSALGFSVLHGIPGLIPAIAVLGLILAWVYEVTRSIWAPVIVHGVYNAVVTTLLYVAAAQGLSVPSGGG